MNNWSIKKRILLQSLLTSLLMFIALSVYYVGQKQAVLDTQLDRKGELLASQLAPLSEYAVFIKNPALLEETVAPIIDDPDVAFVEIYDVDDNLLLSQKNLSLIESDMVNDAKRYESSIKLKDVALESNEFDLSFNEEKENSGASILGRVVVALSTESLSNDRTATLTSGIIIGMFCAIISLLIAIWLNQSITRPIQSMVETVKLYESGILSARVQELSAGELAVLERALNDMAVSLENARRKELEHEMSLEQARDEAESSAIAKSEFILQLSRYLQQSLLMLTAVEPSPHSTPKSNNSPSDDQIPSSELLSRHKDLVKQLLNNVELFSELDLKQFRPKQKWFNLYRVVNRVYQFFSGNVAMRHNQLSWQFPEKFRTSAIYSDERALALILRNLLAISCEQTHDGFIELTISIEPDEQESNCQVSITIKDTGTSIKTIKDLNDTPSFFRLNAKQQSNPFTGLLIANASMLANALEGQLDVEKSRLDGNHFQVRLPLKYRNETPIENTDEPTQKPLVNGRVLIVDSDISHPLLFKTWLDDFAIKNDLALNDDIGFEKLLHHPYSVVIVNQYLPGMKGIEFIHKVTRSSAIEFKPDKWILLTDNKISPKENDENILTISTQIDQKSLIDALSSPMTQ